MSPSCSRRAPHYTSPLVAAVADDIAGATDCHRQLYVLAAAPKQQRRPASSIAELSQQLASASIQETAEAGSAGGNSEPAALWEEFRFPFTDEASCGAAAARHLAEAASAAQACTPAWDVIKLRCNLGEQLDDAAWFKACMWPVPLSRHGRLRPSTMRMIG